MSSVNNFDIGPVFASQIKKLRKSFTWWNQLLCRSVLTPNSCTKFKIHSAHADNPGVSKLTIIIQIKGAAFIKFLALKMWHLFDGGVYFRLRRLFE